MSTINRSKLYKYSLIFCTLLVAILVSLIYILNFDLVILAIESYEGALEIMITICIRIILLFIMCLYLFGKWFKQEAQFLSDIPFLLGLFFLILMFGKALDLFHDITYFTFNDDVVLVLLKVRFFTIIFEVAPLLYLGMEVIFFRLEDKYTKLKNKAYMNRLRTILIAMIVIIESIPVLIGPSVTIVTMILPFILIPSLIGIVYIFYMAYRLNRLTVIKPGILTIGFFLYMLSSIFRPLLLNIIGEEAIYLVIVETIDIIIFLIIFFGLYKK